MGRSVIETNRLRLKEFSIDDSLTLAPILTSPDVMCFSEGSLYSGDPVQFIRHQINSYEQNGFGQYAVYYTETKKLIGCCGLSIQELEDRLFVELSYQIDSAFWGQGVGSEAGLAIKDYAFDELGISNLVSMIKPGNRAAIRVTDKLGMIRQGQTEFRDQIVDVYLCHQLKIITERLLIRELKPEDASELKHLFKSVEVFSSAHLIRNISKGREKFIASQLEYYRTLGHGIWAIVLQGHFIGLGGVMPQKLGQDSINELFLCIDSRFQGKKLGYEAASAIIEYVKEYLSLDSLYSFVDEGDDTTAYLAQSLGMKKVCTIPSESGRTNVYVLT